MIHLVVFLSRSCDTAWSDSTPQYNLRQNGFPEVLPHGSFWVQMRIISGSGVNSFQHKYVSLFDLTKFQKTLCKKANKNNRRWSELRGHLLLQILFKWGWRGTNSALKLIKTNNHLYGWEVLPSLLRSEVQLFGEHGGEAGHLFLPNRVAVGGQLDAPHRHFPVNQCQQLCEFQGASVFVEELTQILDVPRAVQHVSVGVVTLAMEHGR